MSKKRIELRGHAQVTLYACGDFNLIDTPGMHLRLQEMSDAFWTQTSHGLKQIQFTSIIIEMSEMPSVSGISIMLQTDSYVRSFFSAVEYLLHVLCLSHAIFDRLLCALLPSKIVAQDVLSLL